jgi:hypothetical protein
MTFANVAMTLALVFAMTGGAYAAGKYVITSTKQIKPSVLKSLVGKTGPAGPSGSSGPAGSPGPAGPVGKEGPQGKEGMQGKEGGQGTPGEPGKEGKEGSPWTAKGVLPKGSTETGEWNLMQFAPAGEVLGTAISFTIRLATTLQGANVHFIKPEEGAGEPEEKLPAGCSGNFEKPAAASGNLCVFAAQMINVRQSIIGGPFIEGEGVASVDDTLGADTSGTRLIFSPEGEGQAIASGSWAVTG